MLDPLLTTERDSIDFLARGWLNIPQYLEDRKWQNPTSHNNTPLAKGFNVEAATFWELLTSSSAHDAFMSYLATFNEGHKEWTDFYPIVERLGVEAGAETDPTAVMMVDVGGGLGYQAINVKHKFPELPGRFVVQDLAHGLPSLEKRTTDLEYMEHDFNTEQPVKGTSLSTRRCQISIT